MRGYSWLPWMTHTTSYWSDIRGPCNAQTAAPSHSYRRTVRSVRDALGAPVEELFSSFEERPVSNRLPCLCESL